MPISETLRTLTVDRDFWAAYLAPVAGAAPPEPGVLRVSLPVAGGYGLLLDVDLSCGEHTLGLRHPAASEPVHLGGAGPGRPAPAVLRPADLDLIGRVVALDDPTLPHPGLPVALLAPFAAPVTDDDLAAGALLVAAYRSLRRDVRPLPPVLPEQPPLPLFTAARWWPQPAQPCDRVLSDDEIAGYLAIPAGAPAAPRDGPRFPTVDLSELVRHATARLARLREADWYAAAAPLAMARRICLTGDLSGVAALVAALERAGCDHPTVLDALTGPVVPLEAGWVLETLAGLQPGTLLNTLAGLRPGESLETLAGVEPGTPLGPLADVDRPRRAAGDRPADHGY